MKIAISITGHRKFHHNPAMEGYLYHQLDKFLLTLSVYKVKPVFLNGCAIGTDLWFGDYGLSHNIDLNLYLPFPKEMQIEKAKMNKRYIKSFNKQCLKASKVVVVNDTFSTYGYQKRNKSLVDNADLLLTYYNRKYSGSRNCNLYALMKELPTIDLYNEFNSKLVKKVLNKICGK